MGKTKRRDKVNRQRKQNVLSAPGKIFVKRYITPHMSEKAKKEGLNNDQALEKYGKNRYKPNPNAKIIKQIKHTV